MKRNIYKKLLAWKTAKDRKPLLLQGARQVGKTFALKTFATQQYDTSCYLNFEENPLIKTFFQSSLKPERILQQISLYLNQEIKPEETLLIFDEIQECPEALTSLKYFCEEAPRYPIIGAGSLLGVKLSKAKSFPVGKVNFLHLYPLSFFEFLTAIDKEKLKSYLEEIEKIEPLPLAIHAQLLELLRLYIFIGGMPAAVQSYIDSRQFETVRKGQEEILKAYLYDFANHADAHQVNRISSVWQSIPSQLARENKKFIFSAIAKSSRAREYEAAIQWLRDAGLVHQAFNVAKPQFPLEHYAEENAFKLFLFDVGLLGAMTHLAPQMLLNDQQILTEFKGALTENFVAQELICSREQSLFYWDSEGRAEVDFLLMQDHSILPLEAKAGFSRKKKSLLVYEQKYHPPCLLRTSAMNLERNGNKINYPLYMIARNTTLL